MKKNTSYILIALTLLFVGTVANAEDNVSVSASAKASTSVKVQPIKANLIQRAEVRNEAKAEIKTMKMEDRDEVKNKMEENREEMKDLREKMASSTKENRENRVEQAKTRFKNLFSKMIERFGATISRQESITVKIEARIAKIKANGGNTTEAEVLVTEAKHHTETAKTALEALKLSVNTAIDQAANSSSTAITKEGTASMKKASNEVAKHLREAHQALMKTVGKLRGLSQLRPTATTTASTTITN